MVSHNHIIAQNRFRKLGKEWRKHIVTWFDQPAKKKARRLARARRAAHIVPRPLEGKLRPAVRPGGRRHNLRLREGRGFTLEELRKAGLTKRFARSIGIAVDLRRKNRSEEGLNENVQRLKNYRAKLLLFPKKKSGKVHVAKVKEGAKPKLRKNGKPRVVKERKPERGTASKEERIAAKQFKGALFPVRVPEAQKNVVVGKRAIKPEELLPKNSKYLRLRRARASARLVGRRERVKEIRAKKAEEAAKGAGKKQIMDEE